MDAPKVHATVEPKLASALHANATARIPDSILRTLGERLIRSARIGVSVGSSEEDKPARRGSTIPLGRSNALLTTGELQLVVTGHQRQALTRLLVAAG